MLRLATEHAPLATFVRASLLEVTRDLTLFCAAGDVDRHFRRSDERHRLRLYRPDDVTRRLRDAGFRVRRLRGYGDLRFGRGWAGCVATKS